MSARGPLSHWRPLTSLWPLMPLLGLGAWSGMASAAPPEAGVAPPSNASAHAATEPPLARPDASRLDLGLRARRVAERTWVIDGAVDDFSQVNGCNIVNTAFIATGAGVLVINTGPSLLYAQQQRALIARTTREPVVQVVNLNQHPHHFLGNGAWSDVGVQAMPVSAQGMQAEGPSLADNLHRLCGPWQRHTVPVAATLPVPQGLQTLGQHRLEWLRLKGHTPGDLVLIDHTTGVAFVGGLVFKGRAPTTPHAVPAQWLDSLAQLEALQQAGYFQQVVPSHGPVHAGVEGMAQTRDWLEWVNRHLRDSAEAGRDLSELLSVPLPERFAGWAAQPAEWHRTLVQWYPAHEVRALRAVTRAP